MTVEQVSQFLAMIEAGFDRQYQAKARAQLARNLEDESLEASLKAFKYLEAHPEFRPNPLQLIQIIRDQGAQLRERESKQRKHDLPDESPKNTDKEYLTHWSKLTNGMLSGEFTREKILEGFRVMDNIYPGRGWDVQGGILNRHYIKHGHALDGIPKCSMNAEVKVEKGFV